MKILRSSVSAEPWLGTTGGRNLGSTGSSGSDRHTRSEIKVTRAKLLLPPRSDPPAAPALGNWGCSHLQPAPSPSLPAERGELILCSYRCLAEKPLWLRGRASGRSAAQPTEPAPGPPRCRSFSALVLCHLPHPQLFFLWFFPYDCTVLKSYNAPHRIAPAASKLTIQHSISTNFLGHVSWTPMV